MPIDDDEPNGHSAEQRSTWDVGRAIYHGVRAGKYRSAAKQFPDGAETLLDAAEINSRRVSDLLSRPLDGPQEEEVF